MAVRCLTSASLVARLSSVCCFSLRIRGFLSSSVPTSKKGAVLTMGSLKYFEALSLSLSTVLSTVSKQAPSGPRFLQIYTRNTNRVSDLCAMPHTGNDPDKNKTMLVPNIVP
jgi:hypothetical protein